MLPGDQQAIEQQTWTPAEGTLSRDPRQFRKIIIFR